MESKLQTVDLVVLLAYVVGVVAFGSWFVRKSRATESFMVAGRSLPGWAVGLSIFGTYVSSISFLASPGKSYASNWSPFVFGLSLPLAAWIAVRYFVPYYRKSGEVSAYTLLEHRFGAWARLYAMLCYLLTQLARMGTILYLVALALAPLTGWDIRTIIIVTGMLVTMYTLLGGIEAVIWTDVVQAIVLTGGAVVAAAVLFLGMPEGPGRLLAIAAENDKWSLGSFGVSLTEATFWVVLLYGIFINLTNFGIDQNFVQRYHTAKSHRDAARSVWLGALLFLPVSALFFFIGTGLFAYYETHPELRAEVSAQVAEQRLADEAVLPGSDGYDARLVETSESLGPADIGDKVFPHFIVHRLPVGMTGLLIAAIFAAAMSSVDSSLNSSVTVFLSDVYKRFLRRSAGERESMAVLHASTLVWGLAGTGVALAMIQVKSALDAWWRLAGIFSGGMIGLFLLGLIVRRAKNAAAVTAVAIGVLVIVWMTFSPELGGKGRSFTVDNVSVRSGALELIVNGSFDDDLEGWRTEGTVTHDREQGTARLNNVKGSPLWLAQGVKATPGALVRVRFDLSVDKDLAAFRVQDSRDRALARVDRNGQVIGSASEYLESSGKGLTYFVESPPDGRVEVFFSASSPLAPLCSPFHSFMIVVIGTLSILLAGILVSRLATRGGREASAR